MKKTKMIIIITLGFILGLISTNPGALRAQETIPPKFPSQPEDVKRPEKPYQGEMPKPPEIKRPETKRPAEVKPPTPHKGFSAQLKDLEERVRALEERVKALEGGKK